MIEHECPRCHRSVQLPLGTLCPACRDEIEHRATRLAHRIAGGTAILLAGYVWWRLPADALGVQRLVGGMGVVMWYVITYLVAKRTLREVLR